MNEKQVAEIKQERRKIADLNPAAYNPRKDLQAGDEEFERLKRSVEAFGYVDPIIVNKDGTVVGGHQRLKVLQVLGYTEVDCAVVDLSKEDEKALNIALNKIAGEWDEEKLAEIFAELDVEEYDLEQTGFTDEEVEKIMAAFEYAEAAPEDFGEDFQLENTDAPHFKTMSLNFNQAQYETVQDVVEFVKNNYDDNQIRDEGNQNKNANIIYTVVREWAEQKKLL